MKIYIISDDNKYKNTLNKNRIKKEINDKKIRNFYRDIFFIIWGIVTFFFCLIAHSSFFAWEVTLMSLIIYGRI